MDAVDLALQADKQSAAITIPDKAAGMLEGGRNKEENSECTCVVHRTMTHITQMTSETTYITKKLHPIYIDLGIITVATHNVLQLMT